MYVAKRDHDFILHSNDFDCAFYRLRSHKKDGCRGPGQAIQDRIVTSAIKERLVKQATSSKIDVETSHGNVTLSGTVASPAEGNRVIASALSVDGVRSLRPNLTVK